jgi:5'-deoxynucleotidase YfbR-like HD superfamily hydrolase
MSSKKQLEKIQSQIGYVRRGGNMLRYHTLPTTGMQQTVAHHTFGVMNIILTLWPDCSKNLLVAALHHDVPEQVTGDIPAHVKWANPAMKEAIENIEDKFLKDHDLYVELTDSEKRMLAMADLMELILYSHELIFRGDNTYNIPYMRGLEKMAEYRAAPEFGPIGELLNMEPVSKTDIN